MSERHPEWPGTYKFTEGANAEGLGFVSLTILISCSSYMSHKHDDQLCVLIQNVRPGRGYSLDAPVYVIDRRGFANGRLTFYQYGNEGLDLEMETIVTG